MKRNASIDLLRCALMFGICLLHAGGETEFQDRRWQNAFYCCLDAFALISGFFGISFSWRKMLALWTISFECAVVVVGLAWGVGAYEPAGVTAFLRMVKDHAFAHWYLNAYAVLMVLAPMLNAYLDSLKGLSVRQLSVRLAPFFALVCGWSWGVDKFAAFVRLPWTPGLGSYTFLTLAGLYVIGRLIRTYDLLRSVTRGQALALWLTGVAFCEVGLGWYASPFTMLGAVGLFAVFAKTVVPERIAPAVTRLGGCMFAVYLLHTDGFGTQAVSWTCRQLTVSPRYLRLLCSGVLVFLTCLALALVRDSAARAIRRVWNR